LSSDNPFSVDALIRFHLNRHPAHDEIHLIGFTRTKLVRLSGEISKSSRGGIQRNQA
jgi:hypothetical protein